MRIVYMNAAAYENKEMVHNFLAEELNFPDYYGKNFSALYDVLTDICQDTKITLDLSRIEEHFQEGTPMRDFWKIMTNVLDDAAEANPYVRVEYVK